MTFALLGVVSNVAFAQFGNGLLFDDEAYHNIVQIPDYGQKNEVDLPLKVDLKPYCPEIENQEVSNTCTGWAVGYAALTIQMAIQKKWKQLKAKITAHAYSPHFLYNQIKEERNLSWFCRC